MAATLTDDLTRVSVASIEKWEDGPDGTLYVYGRCTTPEVDTDDQVVDSSWSGASLKEWLATAPALRVQHNGQRDPAGSGVQVDVNRDGDGAHWLKAAVDEPVAQRLVKKGHLRAFSVGIARPVIERDVSGKARGGIIRGGKVVEVSLVDSPANRSCFLELAKADKDGAAEFTGKVFADDDTIAKALDADLTKAAHDDDFVNVDLPKGASISISPADFAKLHTFKQQLVTKTAEAAEKRDVNTAERRSLASDGNALPDGSYPIKNTGDLHNAAVLARSGHGDTAAARRLIARRAGELGVANPLDESDGAKKSETLTPEERLLTDIFSAPAAEKSDAPVVQDEAVPDVAKDKPVKKAKKKPKKLPPWLNKPADDDKGDDDGDACKGAHAWIHVGGDGPVPDIRCEKCKTTPAEAAGLTASHAMSAAPVPELLEGPPVASMKSSPDPASASGAEGHHMDPVPAHREPDGAIVEPFEKDASLPAEGQGETPTSMEAGMMKSSPEVAAILRFKRAGIDVELGRLHDLTCPAYHPDDVAKCHPFADLARIDDGYFQRKAVEAACGPDLDVAKGMHLALQAAQVLKMTDPAVLNDFRLEAHKAFRDANPGPTSAPTPGMMAPGKYNRPLITDGHEASSTGHDGPNSSPPVATSAPNAAHFDRPPLAAGHQSPSPSFMKSGLGEYPSEQGRPTQINYAVMEKDRARHALMQMHEHLSRQFPEACPMDLDATAVQPESRGVPPTAGIGKGAMTVEEAQRQYGLEPETAAPHVPLAAFKAPAEDQIVDDAVYKGFKKMRKKLGKKVLAGSMTVDEARARMGRQFAQKAAEPAAEKVTVDVTNSLTKAQMAWIVKGIRAEMGASTPAAPEPVTLEAANLAADPEVIKAAVADATSELKDLLVKQQETFTTKLAEQQKVIDAIADQPDPSTAAFSGLAFNPLRKAAGPAGVPSQAEIAERTQLMMMRTLQDKYNASSDPAEREAYYGTLTKMRGVST